MKKIDLEKMVKWFCSKISFNDIYSVLAIVLEIIKDPRDIKFKEKSVDLPNYRNFSVDSLPPLTQPPKREPVDDYKLLLRKYKSEHGKVLAVVNRHKGKAVPPDNCRCDHCNAPSKYLSYNNGRKMSQVRCKVCKKPSMINKSRPASEVKYRCPHCENRLFKWKEKSDVIIYKCPNFKCRLYLQNKSNLNEKEKNVYDKGKTSHFSLHYIYREYHFKPAELVPSRPHNTGVDLHKAHHTDHTIGLVLTYSISYGLSARMTADLMQNVHSISMSHQTVINYMTSAASYVSRFMEQHKLELTSDSCSADETYLKVKGKNRYTWFVIDTISRAIVGFHLSDERDTKNALIAIIDAFGESPDPLKKGQKPVNFVADGNPSYDAAILEYQRHIEDTSLRPILRRKVIGLENKDDESTEYRQLKQLVERLNRTYKFHTRPRAGFKNMQGAIVLTTLFVVFYNYMRPKTRRTESPPINHNLFKGLGTYQEKWCKILKLAG